MQLSGSYGLGDRRGGGRKTGQGRQDFHGSPRGAPLCQNQLLRSGSLFLGLFGLGQTIGDGGRQLVVISHDAGGVR
jgi:hypothetical protein